MIETDSTIHADVPGNDEDRFIAAYEAKQAESQVDVADENEATETEVEDDQVEDTSEDAGDETEGDETEAEAEIEASDDAVVNVKHGDKITKVKVADLKRLFGQEAELTRKSQEVSSVTKRAEDETTKSLAILDAMKARVRDKWTKGGYDKIDLATAAVDYSRGVYDVLKSDMAALQQEYAFLEQEGGNLLRQVQDNRSEQMREAFSKIDGEMAKSIPTWTKATRDEVVKYAKETVGFVHADNVFDTAAMAMMYKSMLHDRGTKLAAKAVSTAKSSPSNVLKPGSSMKSKPSVEQAAMARLRKTGSMEDAEAVILARFSGK